MRWYEKVLCGIGILTVGFFTTLAIEDLDYILQNKIKEMKETYVDMKEEKNVRLNHEH